MGQRSFKQELKDWWQEYKTPIKVGAACLGVGLVCGFIKGVNTMTKGMIYYSAANGQLDDDFEYTEENVDDPELLELIRLEQEDNFVASNGEES